MHSAHPLLVIAGPTGSGKSELSLVLAKRFSGEVVNCDSIQIYRGFNIGSAKLPFEERRGIPHHLIDIAEPEEVFTAGDFARVARPVLREISDRGKLPIVTGGTGFYIRALIEGLAPGPQRDADLRGRLQGRNLHRLLRRFDPITAERIHPNDTPKLTRAVEICLTARRPATAVFAAGKDALTGFQVLKIGLFPPRKELYERLEVRMEKMFAGGLIAETHELAKRTEISAKPFESIGYKQVLTMPPDEALFYAKQATRQYAKRQMTWFRREPGLVPIEGFGDDPAVIEEISALVTDTLKL